MTCLAFQEGVSDVPGCPIGSAERVPDHVSAHIISKTARVSDLPCFPSLTCLGFQEGVSDLPWFPIGTSSVARNLFTLRVAVLNAFLIMFLVTSIYAILGVSFFKVCPPLPCPPNPKP